MKPKSFLSFFLLYCITIFAQNSNDKIVYLDSLYKPATEANYKYKRIIEDYIEEFYGVKTYYKSGQLKTIGTSIDQDGKILIGTIKNYYENGKPKSIETNSGMKDHEKKYEWYENGQKKAETETYIDHYYLIFKIIQFWDKNGTQLVKDGNGIYEEITKNATSKGSIVNGYKHGIWTGFDKEYNFTFTETYKKGKLVSGTSIDSEKKEYHYKTLCDEGGLKNRKKEHIYKYISKTMPSFNPESPFFNSENEVKLTVDKNGILTKVETIPDINKEIPEVISDILKEYREWIPLKNRGIYCESTCIFTPPLQPAKIIIRYNLSNP